IQMAGVDGKSGVLSRDISSGSPRLLKIPADDEQVRCGGLPPVQARLDDPPADIGRRLVPEVGRSFENSPCRIQRAFLLGCSTVSAGRIAFPAKASGRRFAECGHAFAKCDRVHAHWPPLFYGATSAGCSLPPGSAAP